MEHFGLARLAGGWSGETFLAEASGERTVIRIYGGRGARRGPDAAEIDAAVLRLVHGLLPVPDVLDVRRADPDSGEPALLVTSFLPGERLDTLLPRLSDEARAETGRRLGIVLARLACMPLPQAGRFADADLRVEPWPGSDGLVEWVGTARASARLADWPQPDVDGLLEVADRAQVLLDETDRACLVHSDLNPKNVLVDPETAAVTGLVDWEFAHAGSPVTDLGNLLRFDRDPAFAEAVLAAYAVGVPDADERVLDRARAADLFALVDLAGRRGENPVTEQAHHLLVKIARSGDLHALP